MISTALQAKIDVSIAMIRKAEPIALQYQPYGAVVAFSGGKDSIVLAQLVKESGIKHRLEYNLTTIDPPEVVRFIKQEHPECLINYPKKSFWQICEHALILPSQRIRFCCTFLKERTSPGTLTITGVRHEESYRRKLRNEVEIFTRRRHPAYTRGTFDEFEQHRTTEQQCIRGKDKLIVNPILYWSADDVWNFIRERGLKYPETYSRGYDRVGCLFCPMANEKQIIRQAKDYPKYYQAYLRMIQRINEKRNANGKPNQWQGMTPEQIFRWQASKKSLAEFKSDIEHAQLDFLVE